MAGVVENTIRGGSFLSGFDSPLACASRIASAVSSRSSSIVRTVGGMCRSRSFWKPASWLAADGNWTFSMRRFSSVTWRAPLSTCVSAAIEATPKTGGASPRSGC